MKLAPVSPKPPGKISESELQKAVIAMAHARGWLVAHFRPAQVRPGRYVTPVDADGAGFPDLVMARGERLLFVELKSQKGRLRTEQEVWIDALRCSAPFGTHEVYVWKPKDWVDGTIDKVLL